jgi:hypothetical protein
VSDLFAARLLRLEDLESIRETLRAYGRALDHGSEQNFLDCWTPEAVLVWAPTPERNVAFANHRIVGRAAMLEAFRGHTHAPEMFHKHLLFSAEISLDGDRASVKSEFARIDESDAGPVLVSFGRYSLLLCHQEMFVRSEFLGCCC